MVIALLQIIAHATTAELLWHVQNFVAITWLKFEWVQNDIFVDFFYKKNEIFGEMGPSVIELQ